MTMTEPQDIPKRAEAEISAFVIRTLMERLQAHHLPVISLMREAGIDPVDLKQSDRGISLRRYIQLFERAAAISTDSHLGLHLSQEMGPDSLGAIGYLFLSSTTLAEALENVVIYLGIIQEGTENRINGQGNVRKWIYRINDDRIHMRRQDSEYSVGIIFRLIRLLAGPRYVPDEVHFEHAKVGPLDRYTQIFGAPVYFEQPVNALIMSGPQLSKPTEGIDPRLFPVLQDQLQARITKHRTPRTMAERVQGYLERSERPARIPFGKVARVFGCSEATLRRRLRQRKTSFRRISDTVCHALATRHLEASDMTITEIAQLVGFAEAACFTRAFRRWSGMTPRNYRRAAI
ncbi:MAG: AraC family transcriptional regulator [Sphingomonadales bacterium]